MSTKHIHKITNGTVIDHIKAGHSRKLLDIIGSGDDIVTIGVNFESAKYGRKDILKFDNKNLSDKEIALVSILFPEASISIIRNGHVLEKKKHTKPAIIEGIIACPNPKCISNNEEVTTMFHTSPSFLCLYCERTVRFDEIGFAK